MKVILLFIIILVIFVFLPGSNSWNGCPAGKYKGRRRLIDYVTAQHQKRDGRSLYGSGCNTQYGCPPPSTCLSCHVTDEGCNCVEEKPPCYDCEAGKYGGTGKNCANTCAAGKYGGSRGAGTLSEACPYSCSVGTWGKQWASYKTDACPETCPSGKYSIANVDLGVNLRDSEAHACGACPKGYYCLGNTKNNYAIVTECPVGKYGNTTGSKTEEQGCNGICPKGKYGTASGKTTVGDACTVCKVDHYCDGNMKSCPIGYSTLGNTGAKSATGCKLCSGDCTTCPENTYQTSGGNCGYCPESTPTTAGVTNAADISACVSCGKGNGFKAYGTAASTCYQCDVNFRGIGYGVCSKCGPNEIAAKGSSECFSPSSLKKQFTSSMDAITVRQGGIIKAVALSNAKSNEVKQKAKGLVAKLSLDWATADVIMEAQKLRDQLAQLPEYNVSHHCQEEKERLAYGVLRTGIIVPQDAEIDNKYCLNENRNRLISSFCNFRPRFIKLLQEKLYPKLPSSPKYTGRELWPNICCRKDNFQDLKSCDDPTGKVPRSHVVPFALTQGLNLTAENLYGEIVDIIKKDGYLQQGMSKAIDGIKDSDKLKTKLNNLFGETLLCGPREFGLPTNEAIRLCELFYPYEHMLGMYYNEVNALLKPLQRRRRRRILGVWPRMANSFTNMINSASAFMFGANNDEKNNDEITVVRTLQSEIDVLKEQATQSRDKMQRLEEKNAISLDKITHLERKDAMLEKEDTILTNQANKTNTVLAILKQNGKTKRRLGSGTQDEFCPFVTMADVSQYEKDIDEFCTGYAHIDLNHNWGGETVVNLAIMTPWDLPPKMIPGLREQARYEVSDDCPTPMFTANDISLQNIDGKDLFVVQLDATSPNGYLKKELPQCGTTNNIALKPHIPKTTIDVKIWRDHEDCCKDTKDYKVCKEIKCLVTDGPNGIEPVNDPWTKRQIGYRYDVVGTTYSARCDNKPNNKPCGVNSRRRQLLQDEYGNSGERL